MEEHKNNNPIENDSFDKIDTPFVDKVSAFFKNNMVTLILILVCIVYIFRGVANIEYSGKTIFEIVADTFITFIVGITIKSLMGKNGIMSGRMSPKYLRTTKLYGEQLDSITHNVEHLDMYCDYKNWLALRRKQTTILRKAGLTYRKFSLGDYDDSNDPEVIQAVKKAREVDIFPITSFMILNVIDASEEHSKILKLDVKTYEKTKLRNNMLIGASIALLFGLCSLEKGVWDWSGILWTAIQTVLFLALGCLEYMNGYEFISETFRGKIIIVISFIDEFKNLLEKRPDIFTADIEEFQEEQAEKERLKALYEY